MVVEQLPHVPGQTLPELAVFVRTAQGLVHVQHAVAVLEEKRPPVVGGLTDGDFHVVDGFLVQVLLCGHVLGIGLGSHHEPERVEDAQVHRREGHGAQQQRCQQGDGQRPDADPAPYRHRRAGRGAGFLHNPVGKECVHPTAEGLGHIGGSGGQEAAEFFLLHTCSSHSMRSVLLRRFLALRMRVFTVPSGMPRARAISATG